MSTIKPQAPPVVNNPVVVDLKVKPNERLMMLLYTEQHLEKTYMSLGIV